MVLLGALAVGLQIDQVILDDARPDDVDHDDVDVAGLGREQLPVQRKAVGGAAGLREHLDGVARLLRPLFGVALAELEVGTRAAAGDGNGGGLNAEGGAERQQSAGTEIGKS